METGLFIEAIGLLSSIIIALMFVPQIYQIILTKETTALNYTFLLLNLFASLLGFSYAYYHMVSPMIIANTSAFISSLSIIFLKYYYEKLSLAQA